MQSSRRELSSQSRMTMKDLLKLLHPQDEHDTTQTPLSCETWYHVFGFLKSHDLLKQRLVCRELNDATRPYLMRDYHATLTMTPLFKCKGSIRCIEPLANRNIAISTHNNTHLTSLLYYPNYILDHDTGLAITYFQHKEWFTVLKSLPNQSIISAPHDENTLYIWDEKTGKCIKDIPLNDMLQSSSFATLEQPLLNNLIVINDDIVAVSYSHVCYLSPDHKTYIESEHHYFINIHHQTLLAEIKKSVLPIELLRRSHYTLPNGDTVKYKYNNNDGKIYIEIYDKIKKQCINQAFWKGGNHTYFDDAQIHGLPDGNVTFTVNFRDMHPHLAKYSHQSCIYTLSFPMKLALENDKPPSIRPGCTK